MTHSYKPIALALSGGGIRAIVFHLGVLRHLAERGFLESVERISTVSGGSLLIGLLLQLNDMRWPTAEQFLSRSLPARRELLYTRSIPNGVQRGNCYLQQSSSGMSLHFVTTVVSEQGGRSNEL